jgi:hypothetical protein
MTEEIFQKANELRLRVYALEMLKNQILAMTHGALIVHKVETEIFGVSTLTPIRQDFRMTGGLTFKEDINFFIDSLDNRINEVKSEIEKL